jgi:hypothetical protein
LAELAGANIDALESIDMESEIIRGASCLACDLTLDVVGSVVDVRGEEIRCPSCEDLASLEVARSIAPDEELAGLPLSVLRLPERDVVTLRSATDRRHLILETV